MRHITISIILISLLFSGCSPEAKYKYLSIFIYDNAAPEQPLEKKTFEKTDLYPGEPLIEKYQTDQLATEESVTKEETGSISETSAPEAPPDEERIIRGELRVPKPKSFYVGKSVYSLNVGVFTDREYAYSFLEKLNQKGYDAFILRNTMADGTLLYRVLVGKFNNVDETVSLRKLLQKDGIESFAYTH